MINIESFWGNTRVIFFLNWLENQNRMRKCVKLCEIQEREQIWGYEKNTWGERGRKQYMSDSITI